MALQQSEKYRSKVCSLFCGHMLILNVCCKMQRRPNKNLYKKNIRGFLVKNLTFSYLEPTTVHNSRFDSPVKCHYLDCMLLSKTMAT